MKKNIFLHVITTLGCMICAILLCAAQTSFLPNFLNDALFVSDLLLCMTVGLGVLTGRTKCGTYVSAYAVIFGIFAGILADCTAGCGIFLLPLLYMLCGYGAYVCADLLPYKKFFVYLAVGAASAALRVIVAVIYVLLSEGSVPLPDIAQYVCIPLFLGTVIALLPVYPASLLLTLPIRKIKHQNIDKFT